MEPTAKIFVYRGHLAATTRRDGNFINDINGKGQLGCVIAAGDITISKEAKTHFKNNYARETGSFATTMLTKGETPEKSSIGLFGFGRHYIGRTAEIGRDCDLDVLDDFTEGDVEIPQDFKDFVDEIEDQEPES